MGERPYKCLSAEMSHIQIVFNLPICEPDLQETLILTTVVGEPLLDIISYE